MNLYELDPNFSLEQFKAYTLRNNWIPRVEAIIAEYSLIKNTFPRIDVFAFNFRADENDPEFILYFYPHLFQIELQDFRDLSTKLERRGDCKKVIQRDSHFRFDLNRSSTTVIYHRTPITYLPQRYIPNKNL